MGSGGFLWIGRWSIGVGGFVGMGWDGMAVCDVRWAVSVCGYGDLVIG